MYCKKCGAFMKDRQNMCSICRVPAGVGKKYCAQCGYKISSPADGVCFNCASYLRNTSSNGPKSRSLLRSVLFHYITFGFYSIHWFISLTNEMNQILGRPYDTSGFISFLFSIVTFGVYSHIWAYNMGQKCDMLAKKEGNTSILYLILSLCGLSVVVYVLSQYAINKEIEN